MILAEPIAVTLEVTAALGKLGLRYVVGGSIASSMHGIPRSTQDIDLLVELPGRAIEPLVAELEGAFYVDEDMIADAVRRSGSFNIVHLKTMYKVDVFVADRSALVEAEFERRQQLALGDPPREVYVCSPEDIVLQKLDWFRKGNEISERQWNDLVGVIKVQGDRLDAVYVRRWAERMGLSELAERAFREGQAPEG